MAATASARMRLDLDSMIGGGQPSVAAGAVPSPLGEPPPRSGKGGRRPKKARPGRAEPGEPGDPNAPMVGPLWKTRLCNFHAAGGCRNSSQCPFAHGEEDLRASPDFERTSVCPSLLSRGTCDRPGCRYAHHADELRVQEGLLKTKMCAFYQNDQCIVGDACRFAHSEREIQEALAMQRAAAQRSFQPPPPAAEPAAQERSKWQLRRWAFVYAPDAETAFALAPGPRGEPRQLPERPGQQAPREPSPPAPSAAESSGPRAFSLTAPPGLLEFPARVSDSKVVIDAGGGLAEIEDMVLDVEEEVIASNILLESGLPRKVPLPAPCSSPLLARVVTLEEEIAELAPREPAASSRPRKELRCAKCGAELAPDQRFCSACGARVPAAAALPAAEAPSGGPAGPSAGSGPSGGFAALAATSRGPPSRSDAAWAGLGAARHAAARAGAAPRAIAAAAPAPAEGGAPPPAPAAAPPSPRGASEALPEVRPQRIAKRLRKEALVPKPTAPPRDAADDDAVVLDIEDDSLVAELTKARLELGQPGAPLGEPGAPAALGAVSSRLPTTRSDSPPRQAVGASPGRDPSPPRGLPLQRRRRVKIGVGADFDEFDLDDGAGGGGSVRAVAPRASWPGPGCRNAGRYAGCALCPRANGSHAAGGAACAACTCGVKVVHQNTFLTVQDDEALEERHGAARRSLSV